MTGGGIKVLVIEGDPARVQAIQAMLAGTKEHAFEVVCVDQLQTGFGRLAGGGADVVLLDLFLPDSGGPETFTRLHTHFPHIPIIVLHDVDDEALAMKVVKDGAQDYLVTRDLAPGVLSRVIRYAIERNMTRLRRQQTIENLQDLSETKSQFVAEASHELRTPLGIIREFISLVHDEVAGPITEKQRSCLSSALRNCDRLTELINRMLDLAKIEAGKVEMNRVRMDLLPVLKQCHEDFLLKAGSKKQSLLLDVPDNLPAAYADSSAVANVLANIVGNACKFTGEGGTIRIGCHPEGQFLSVWVQDTGCGISREDQNLIFQAFYQVNRQYGPGAKGTGLGLTIAKHLAELNGGYMSVESEPGKGSKFSFVVPLYHKEAPRRVLVIDDEEMIVKSVERYLKTSDLNLDVRSTLSGLEALIIAGQFKPNLVILDVNMAEVGGMRVLTVLREKMPDSQGKVLLISGDPDALKDYKEKGADDCLNKPFLSADLIKKTVDLLGIERRRR